jgi:hypothetical protein
MTGKNEPFRSFGMRSCTSPACVATNRGLPLSRSTQRRWLTSSARPPAKSLSPLPRSTPTIGSGGCGSAPSSTPARSPVPPIARPTGGAAPRDRRGLHRQVRHQSRRGPPHPSERRQRASAAPATDRAEPGLVRILGWRGGTGTRAGVGGLTCLAFAATSPPSPAATPPPSVGSARPAATTPAAPNCPPGTRQPSGPMRTRTSRTPPS